MEVVEGLVKYEIPYPDISAEIPGIGLDSE